MHEVLVNRLGGLSLPRKSVVRLTDRPDMTLDVYRGRKTTMQQQQQQSHAKDWVSVDCGTRSRLPYTTLRIKCSYSVLKKILSTFAMQKLLTCFRPKVIEFVSYEI